LSNLSAFLRSKPAVATLLIALAAAAAIAAFHDRSVSVEAGLPAALTFGIGAAATFVHLRHGGLAALAAIAPVPGLLAAAPALAHLPSTDAVAAYGVGFVVAGLLAAAITRAILDGAEAIEAVANSFRPVVLPILVGILVAALFAFDWGADRAAGLWAGVAVLAAVISAVLYVSLGVLPLTFDEAFFVRANRARDSRERRTAFIAVLGEPRWGWSVSGVGLVLVVVAWFAMAPLIPRGAIAHGVTVWAGSAVALAGVAFGFGRDWRLAVAAAAAISVSVLMGLWLWQETVGPLTTHAGVEIALADAAGLIGAAVVLHGYRRFRRAGDESDAARMRSVETHAFALWASAGSAAATLAPSCIVHGSVAIWIAVLLLGCAAATILMPALATALESLLPRRRSVEELYGRR
jgi:hypothetical protein